LTASKSIDVHDITERLVQAQVPATLQERVRAAGFNFADAPALTAALRAGDDRAFRWLHAQWNGRLSRYCFALASGDDALAAEIAQATYVRLARHVHVLPSEDALWNWLALAARCAAAELRRAGGRYRSALARFADWLNLRWHESPADADSAMLAALDTALALLSDDERGLIDARYFQRHSLDEIGVRLGATSRAIEGRLARLRERLRQSIAAELAQQSAL
jgi:RNA polymerase sigma-70 factor (ECF subfamily)